MKAQRWMERLREEEGGKKDGSPQNEKQMRGRENEISAGNFVAQS